MTTSIRLRTRNKNYSGIFAKKQAFGGDGEKKAMRGGERGDKGAREGKKGGMRPAKGRESFSKCSKQLTAIVCGYIILALKVNVTAMAQAHKRKGESRSFEKGGFIYCRREYVRYYLLLRQSGRTGF